MPDLAHPDRWLIAAPLLALGTLVLAALLAGEGVHRLARLPRIVGYGALGIAAGFAGVVPAELRDELRLAIDFCMGAVLFELGTRVDFGWLRRAPWLAVLALGESALVGIALFWVFNSLFAVPPTLAACGAALGMATSPPVVLRIAKDTAAQGQVTERMLLLSAVNTAAAIVLLAVLLPVVAPSEAGAGHGPLWAGAVAVGGSLALAALLAGLALAVLRAAGRRRDTLLTATFGMIAVAAGSAAAAGLPIPLVLFAFGLLVRATEERHRSAAIDFGRAGQLVYVLLFVLAGASLELRVVAGLGALALAFIVTRAAAKAAAVVLLARVTRQPLKHAALLGLTLQPMSAVTVVLAQDALAALPALGAGVVPAVLLAVVVFEVLGPLCVQTGLRLAGEAEPVAA